MSLRGSRCSLVGRDHCSFQKDMGQECRSWRGSTSPRDKSQDFHIDKGSMSLRGSRYSLAGRDHCSFQNDMEQERRS